LVIWQAGASSGLGLHTARQLAFSGMTVVCGARSYENVETFRDGRHQLYLDVRNEASVERFVEKALQIAGAPDALVCTQGLLVLGACEDYTDQDLMDVMDTNFFGQVRLIRQVLPIFRKNGHGRIVLFSSVNGVLGIPFQGAYTASKHAIEGFAEALRMEVRPFNVSVMVVEPGDHQSGSGKYRKHTHSGEKGSPYYERYHLATARIAHDEEHGSDPDRLGKRIVKALNKKRLPAKLLIASPDQKLAVLLHRLLPARMFSGIISSYYRRTTGSLQ